jgi:hypothetical protein
MLAGPKTNSKTDNNNNYGKNNETPTIFLWHHLECFGGTYACPVIVIGVADNIVGFSLRYERILLLDMSNVSLKAI